ncbi:nucleotidyltransferase substrate binding protein [Lunatimonas salinarum]|uniref:nucleotidyltransferase substrate binding protein n=1 Tax=Lunatimonas salinarum TaxID=1774590 RepID=UPI001AE0AF07|nr:nucleotidyltransferase substrate binding protein [Lunatimonas salinarum]
MEEDIRWEQRFSNFVKALRKLSEAVNYIKQKEVQDDLGNSNTIELVDEIIREGLIQRFEYTHELAWNVMKDYAVFQGNSTIGGSRDATREAFQLKLVTDGKVWMDMIGSRNRTSHTYNEETAAEIFSKIMDDYYPAFLEFERIMEEKRSGDQGKL